MTTRTAKRNVDSAELALEVLEARILTAKARSTSDIAISLLSHQHLGEALVVGRVSVVDLVAIEEHDDVCILLDRS